MTDRGDGTARGSNRDSMAAVSHIAPQNPRNVFSEMFRRGQVIQADGGQDKPDGPRKARDATGSGHASEDVGSEMREVDHEIPEEEGVSRVWERGGEDDDEE